MHQGRNSLEPWESQFEKIPFLELFLNISDLCIKGLHKLLKGKASAWIKLAPAP